MYLEDVGQISQVEDIVELDGRGQEGRCDLAVKGQCPINECARILLHVAGKAVDCEMLGEDTRVDCHQSLLVREVHGEHSKMSL